MNRSDCPTHAPITSSRPRNSANYREPAAFIRSPFRPLPDSSRLPGKPGRATWRT
jgi:hypothetical protein